MLYKIRAYGDNGFPIGKFAKVVRESASRWFDKKRQVWALHIAERARKRRPTKYTRDSFPALTHAASVGLAIPLPSERFLTVTFLRSAFHRRNLQDRSISLLPFTIIRLDDSFKVRPHTPFAC